MLMSCPMGVLMFSLVMSSSQPDGLVSQELITSVKTRGWALEASSSSGAQSTPAQLEGGGALPQQHRTGRGVLTPEGETDPTWLGVLPMGQWSGARGAMGPPLGALSLSVLGAVAGALPLPDRKLAGMGQAKWLCQRSFCLASKLR